MEDDLNISDDLNFCKNLQQVEDDLTNFSEWKTTSNFWKMEDDLNILAKEK
jgi:hypothetical protein